MSALFRWTTGEPVRATARQIERFGPMAGRVLDLMRSVPRLSDEAAELALDIGRGVPETRLISPVGEAEQLMFRNNYDRAMGAVNELAPLINRGRYIDQVYNDADELASMRGIPELSQLIADAGQAEVVGDYLLNTNPGSYETLISPLAIGRRLDVLRGDMLNRQATPFMANVRSLRGLNQINTPDDISAIRDLTAQRPDLQQMALDILLSGRTRNVREALQQAMGMYRDMGAL